MLSHKLQNAFLSEGQNNTVKKKVGNNKKKHYYSQKSGTFGLFPLAGENI